VKLLALLLGLVAVGGQPTRAQVVEHEYWLNLSRLQLKPGHTIIEVDNFGQDPHDLRIQRIGAHHIAGTKVVPPGGRTELALNLPPGRYSIWCSIADHRKRGMYAVLTVKR
jgi:hypothetical protein